MNTCYVVCAVECNPDFERDETDLVIAADAGYSNLIRNNIKPDAVVGDFDSYPDAPSNQKIVKYKREKDETDSFLAINYGVEKGYKKVVVYGGIGGKIDHTIANIQLILYYLKKGINVLFVYEDSIISGVSGRIEFDGEAKGRISVFTLNDKACGVNEKGLKYKLNNYEMTNSFPIGVSNEFTGEKSEISVDSGYLIIVTSKNNFNHLTFR